MRYSVPKSLRQSRPPVFVHRADGELVFVKQKRRFGKNPLGHVAQRLLYRLTRNILVLPPEWPSGNSVEFETGTLRRLAAMGVNVPDVLYQDDDYFVMANAGETLEQYLTRHPDEKKAVVDRATEALARFHRKGSAHGGAQIKNITIKDGEIYFIDFETSIPPRRLKEFQLRDVFLFILSLERHGHDPDLRHICRVYDGVPSGPVFAGIRQSLLAIRIVCLLDNRLLAKLSMRDIRSLVALIRKAGAVDADTNGALCKNEQ